MVIYPRTPRTWDHGYSNETWDHGTRMGSWDHGMGNLGSWYLGTWDHGYSNETWNMRPNTNKLEREP
jgi:hypothetical protein